MNLIQKQQIVQKTLNDLQTVQILKINKNNKYSSDCDKPQLKKTIKKTINFATQQTTTNHQGQNILNCNLNSQPSMSQTVYEQHHVPAYCFAYCHESCINETINYEFGLSSIFTIFTLIISIYHITMHLNNFNNPFFQSKIIVILIMAPFYCVTSMGSFLFPNLQAYFTLTRDFYEAILLFTFFYLIFSYLAYDRDRDEMEDKKVYVIMIQNEKEVHHFFPFNYCQKPYQLTHWKKAKYFTYRCKKYVLQFLIVKLATTFLMYIIYPNQNLYKDPEMQGHQQIGQEQHETYLFVSSLVSWIVAISASYSLYYLVLFYHALHKPLAPYSPLLKFLTIKITLFFTFWQKIMITIFQEQFFECFDRQAPSFNERVIISSLQNTLICFQMLIMAFAGGLAYSYENYTLPKFKNKGKFMYVMKDTIKTFQKDFRLIKPKKFGFKEAQNREIQLQQINWFHRESATADVIIMKPLKQIIIQDYF